MSPRPPADLVQALVDAGGVDAPPRAGAHLRALLLAELAHGARELRRARAGYARPVVVGFAADHERRVLCAAVPVSAALRADPETVSERGWLVVAGTVGALVYASGLGPPAADRPADPAVRASGLEGFLVLSLPTGARPDAELAALAFDDQVADIDRLRARAHALPHHALNATQPGRPPIGAGHPLHAAELMARLGGRPASPVDDDALEEAVVALLHVDDPGPGRPHSDPDPVRRAARRILQRLSGMGKWGGYHTEFRHLARGFAPSEVALALEVSERLLDAGLLVEKISVGQRHVFLNPRRARDIYTLIDHGGAPPGLRLPAAP